MAVALPALAGLAAGWAYTGLSFSFLGAGILGATAAGAIVGGVVGGIQSAVQNGNILEGVLYGAVGGAVGGAIGGWIAGPGLTEMTTSEYLSGDFLVGKGGAVITKESVLTQVPSLGPGGEAVKEGATGLTTADKLVAAQSIGGALQGLGAPEELSKEEQLAEREKDRELQRELANIAASSRGGGSDAYRVAQLQAEVAREEMKQKGSEFEKSLAFQREQMMTPIEEERARREAMRETLIGTKVVSKVDEEDKGSALLPV